MEFSGFKARALRVAFPKMKVLAKVIVLLLSPTPSQCANEGGHHIYASISLANTTHFILVTSWNPTLFYLLVHLSHFQGLFLHKQFVLARAVKLPKISQRFTNLRQAAFVLGWSWTFPEVALSPVLLVTSLTSQLSLSKAPPSSAWVKKSANCFLVPSRNLWMQHAHCDHLGLSQSTSHLPPQMTDQKGRFSNHQCLAKTNSLL